MGFLDELKDKTEEFGEKAKEGFGRARTRPRKLSKTSRTASMVTMPARPPKIPPRVLKRVP